jgi:hypothetical protein
MSAEVDRLSDDLVNRARRYGIDVIEADLDDEIPGEFDGPTITLNHDYDPAERAFYLAHSIGSIAEWSIHPDRSQGVFSELRAAKESRTTDPNRFERVIDAYLSFETRTWEFAVWLLEDTRHAALLGPFANFGRADMEAMRLFHTTGKAPVWLEFFAEWNRGVRQGERTIAPLSSRPIPDFHAITIPKQRIVQEDQDGDG